MALYALGSKGLVDESNLAILDAKYNDKLLEADNVYLNRVNLLTRRPPLIPKGFEFEPGEILDSKSTKEHYVIVRRVDLDSINPDSIIFDHITNGGDTLETRTMQTGTLPDSVSTANAYFTGTASLLTSYEITPKSDLVAIEFYDKKTGTLSSEFSYMFAIHSPESSDEDDGNKASNHLAKLGSEYTQGPVFNDRGQEPSIVAIYSHYTQISANVRDLKYAPPTYMAVQYNRFGEAGRGVVSLQDAAKSAEYITYKEDPAHRILSRHYNRRSDVDFKISDYEFINLNVEGNNVDRISVFNDNVVFTFCGLGYTINNTGVLSCIHHPSVLLPTVKEINQDTVKTYPISRFIGKDVTIPVNVFFHKGVDGTGDTKDLSAVEQMSGDDFRARYPEYSTILDRLSLVITYVPVQSADGEYSETDYYAMPDIKLLIPETDIPADCKFIMKGRTKKETAWFGVPCLRNAYLDGNGLFTETDNDRFPSGNGISMGGVGCSAALFERDETKEGIDEVTILNRAMKRVFDGDLPPAPKPPKPVAEDTTNGQDASDTTMESTPAVQETQENVDYGHIPYIAFNLQRGANIPRRQIPDPDREGETMDDPNDPNLLKESVAIKKMGNDAQLGAYVHFELQYDSFEYLNFFLDKPLLSLPSATGKKGYSFEVLRAGGLVIQSQSTPNSVCTFPDDDDGASGLGYVTPHAGLGDSQTDNSILDTFTLYKRKNLLNNKQKNKGILAKSEGLTVQGVAASDLNQSPLRFSASGVYFPMNKTNLTYTNIRNMFYAGNELNVSSSEDVSANIFYEPLKYYLEFLGNRTTSLTVFFDMGFYNVDFKYDRNKDPNSFTTVNKEGHSDPIRQVVLLDNRLIVHTETGLSRINEEFGAVQRFADVPITTNLITDSTALIGANKDRVYVAGFENELGGYTSDDLNKELREFPYIREIVDMLDSHRLALFLPKKGNVIYALSQFVDRRFKGFSRFILPVTIVKVFRESFDTVIIVDENSNVYSMNFKTGVTTDFTDHFVNDDGETEDTPLISTIRKSNLVAVDSESTTFFSEQAVSRMAIGMSGLPKFGLEFLSDGDRQCKVQTKQHETPSRQCDVQNLDGIEPLQNPQPFYCYDKEDEDITTTVDAEVTTPIGPATVQIVSVTCNTAQWTAPLEKVVKTVGIDFGRKFVFVGDNENRVKIYRRDWGTPPEDPAPEWGEYTSKQGKLIPDLVDFKCRSDRRSSLISYNPYYMRRVYVPIAGGGRAEEFIIYAVDYDAATSGLVDREILSGRLDNVKSFCFLSDSLVAVLAGNSIHVYNLKRYSVNDRELAKIWTLQLDERISNPISIDVMGGFTNRNNPSFLAVITRDGIYRVKIPSGTLLIGDATIFTEDFKMGLQNPVGCVCVDNWVFTMNRDDGQLHRFVLTQDGESDEATPLLDLGPTSDVIDKPECGIPIDPTSVTLQGGGTAMLPVPVENDLNAAGPGNQKDTVSRSLLASIVEDFRISDVNVPVGDGNARLFGVSQTVIGVVVREDDGEKLRQYTYSGSPASGNPVTFTEGEKIDLSIAGILSVLPLHTQDFYIGSQDGKIYNLAGETPPNVNSSEFFERVNRMTIHYQHGEQNYGYINMLSNERFRSFAFNTFSNAPPRKIAEFEINTPSTVVGVIFISNYFLIVRASGEVSVVDMDGASARITQDGSADFKLENGINSIGFEVGLLWYQLNDGNYKSVDVTITTAPSQTMTKNIRLAVEYTNRLFMTAKGEQINNEGAFQSIFRTRSGTRARRRRIQGGFLVGSLFYDRLYQLRSNWQVKNSTLYSNGASGFFFLKKYSAMYGTSRSNIYENNPQTYIPWERISQRSQGPPASPFYETMFVDEARVFLNRDKNKLLGQGGMPECMCADEDNLFIPWDEGDVVPYNIKDFREPDTAGGEGERYNYGRGMVDPTKGAKLAYANFINAPYWRWSEGARKYTIRYLYNLLMLRAGTAEWYSGGVFRNAEITSDTLRLFPDNPRGLRTPSRLLDVNEMAQEAMGGVSAMTTWTTSQNVFTTIYGVSVAYDNQGNWENWEDKVGTARKNEVIVKNSARRTGSVTGGAESKYHAVNKKPYLIIQTADARDFRRGHGRGNANNYRTFDVAWNLVGKGGVDSDNVANNIKFDRDGNEFSLGKGTFCPFFGTESSVRGFPGYANITSMSAITDINSIEANSKVINDNTYAADPRYTYRMITSDKFNQNSRITCVFRDNTYVYVITQDDTLVLADIPMRFEPTKPPKGRLFRCLITDLIKPSVGLDPKASPYEEIVKNLGRTTVRAYNLRRAKLKNIPSLDSNADFEEIKNNTGDTYDYSTMYRDQDLSSKKVPSWEYFYNIEWDEEANVFIGATCFELYVLDRNFNYISSARFASSRLKNFLTTPSVGYKTGDDYNDKVQAICISPKNKKVFFLKRRWKQASIGQFYTIPPGLKNPRIDVREPRDQKYSLRASLSRPSNKANRLNARRAYNNEPTNSRDRRWFDTGGTVYGMSIPYVTEMGYALAGARRTTTAPKTSLRLGEDLGIPLKIVTQPQPPANEIFNPVDVGHSLSTIYMLAENRAKRNYNKTICYNINEILSNTIERKPDKEVEIPSSEYPVRVDALDGEVYVAVDDGTTSNSVRTPPPPERTQTPNIQGQTRAGVQRGIRTPIINTQQDSESGRVSEPPPVPPIETLGLPPDTPATVPAPIGPGEALPALNGWGNWYRPPQVYGNGRYYDYGLYVRFEHGSEHIPNREFDNAFRVLANGAWATGDGYEVTRSIRAYEAYPNAEFRDRTEPPQRQIPSEVSWPLSEGDRLPALPAGWSWYLLPVLYKLDRDQTNYYYYNLYIRRTIATETNIETHFRVGLDGRFLPGSTAVSSGTVADYLGVSSVTYRIRNS